MKTIIIGAGFTGLAAGIKSGFPIYESKEHAGGICRTYYKDGFSFEVGGGHWIFGKGKGLEYIKNLVPLKEYIRDASVYFHHRFPYPIQTTAQQAISTKEGTLKHWLANNFSQSECNLFFFPFNEKYTCGLYEEVIQDDTFKTPPAGSQGYVAKFHYPIGGLDTLIDKMAGMANVQYNKTVKAIDTINKKIFFDDKTIETYDKLISTMPLDRLLYRCGRWNHSPLPYTSVIVFNIGAEMAHNTPKEHWLYVPFCKSNFFRIQFYSNIEPSKAPQGKVGICVEMAVVGNTMKLESQINEIEKNVINELQSWGFIGDVIISDPTYVNTAYTWLYDKKDREYELQWLRDRDIYSVGRYGAWKFCGMTESIEQGLNVIDEVTK